MAIVKVLSMSSLQFRLPDDFDGDISTALRALADYHDEACKKPTSSQENIDRDWYDLPYKSVNSLSFDQFIDVIREGKRLYGLFTISSCDVDGAEAL